MLLKKIDGRKTYEKNNVTNIKLRQRIENKITANVKELNILEENKFRLIFL